MRTIYSLCVIAVFLILPCSIARAQVRHIAWPVTLGTQPVKKQAIDQNRQIAAIQSDTLFFSSPDPVSTDTYSQSFGGSTTMGVFFTLPDSLFPVKIIAFVVNFYGGSSQYGNELSPASIEALLWENVKVPSDIQPSNQIRDSFGQTISVSVDQYMPVTFSFSDTSMIMSPANFAVGIQYSGVSDTTKAVSPIFSTPPAVYSEFYIDSTAAGGDTTANYYDHQSYWTDPTKIGNISGWLILEHDPDWVPTAIDKPYSKPGGVSILSNYPNPFNPTTQLAFVSGSTGHAVLEIYDILGRLIYKQTYQVQSGQTYHWNWTATNFHSGIYLARVRINNQVITHKMTLLK